MFKLFPSSLPRTSCSIAFEETLPPLQAREFGHRQALLMFFCSIIMPQSLSLQSGLAYSCWPQVPVKNGTKFFCSTTFSYQEAQLHLDVGGIASSCAVRAWYTQCWTALRFAMVFSKMFFTKTEPGSHLVHPTPSLRL